MLIKCPECELQVSNAAYSCPHCGYPLKKSAKNIPRKRRMRLPNGFGQISEIKNKNLRKPFRAMVTVGKTPEGRPIARPLKPVTYFKTYNEAYAALVEYNKSPYDIDKDITMSDLFNKWYSEYCKRVVKVSAINVASIWKYCTSVYDIRVKDLRIHHIKTCIEDGTIEVAGKIRHPGESTKARIKSVFNSILDYAVEYGYIEHNISKDFKYHPSTHIETNISASSHMSFTDDEMHILWSYKDNPVVQNILIQCYSGWRPQELGLIKLSDVDLDNCTFTGGMKTEAGKGRTVPIHDYIREIVLCKYKESMELNNKYLLSYSNSTGTGLRLSYSRYLKEFNQIKDVLNLNPNHKPHDCRVHFITMAKKYNMDEYAIKYIVGHTISDITERVYTDRDIKWLKNEMKKIKGMYK